MAFHPYNLEMTKFFALNISVSEDGFMAGPNQSLEAPLGQNAMPLHEWIFATKSFKKILGESGGSTGIDNDFIERGFTNIGATIMGRNMFGPIRGDWPDDKWQGWWGPNPVFEHPVFVLTHHPRESIDMGNGTIFKFVTGGIEQAYEMALLAAKDKDIRLGGGAQTIQQFMESALLDEIHIAQVPVKLGSWELLFNNPDLQLKHYRPQEPVKSQTVQHITYITV